MKGGIMGYWEEMYGNEKKGNKDFIEGLIIGVEAYAHWEDGELVVGILKETLKEIIAEIKEELE